MLIKYILNAMEHAHYKLLPDGEYYGCIPICKGVWASSENLEDCRNELQEVLEEWIILKLKDNEDLPAINGICIKTKVA